MGEFKHKHSLGQNFLKDTRVLGSIIDSTDVKEDDLVIEIGPGQGALTKFLKLYKANLICFEIDKRVENYLKKFVDDKTKIVYKDFMDVDVSKELEGIKFNNLYVIANLPYYITTPILKKIIDSKLDVKEMTLMVQNEVADRFSAKPGSRDYGAVTVYLNYYYNIEKLLFVSRKCFDPAPNVDSAVIKLVKNTSKIQVIDEGLFNKLVVDSFHMKRKTINNNLKGYNLEIVKKVLEKYNLDLTCRAENIPLDCFIDMSNELSK
ncbi:MAG TPA: ribosomal RNA small subunit methyltransferase A [Firmicutes bacterium]|nr:ribosomal RNA small subunit methyltransferase A [Bacillota bacterium]